ncbi:MAG: ribosome biogenesis GTPase YlqF [Oscillospiraceae bacterium]|nr:ribosome biogenesis GTPase YlqF [Oscillospiraceae bacterium]
MNIQWYPGHMTKTRRQMEQDIRLVDAVCEIVDARIPLASRNPDIDSICGNKPRMMILNRTDMADPAATKKWAAYFRKQGMIVLETDAKNRKGTNQFAPKVRELLKEKLQRYQEKGQAGRTIRVMIVGIPNVGKSTLINQVAGRKSAKAENRPGVTRGKQWVTVERGLELLDTPGILWPKFDDPQVGLHLAVTGAVKDDVVDIEELAICLMELLGKHYPNALETRYKVTVPENATGLELLELCGKKRGMLISGGEVDLERMSRVLLEEFRSCKLGRFTLELPPDREEIVHEEG